MAGISNRYLCDIEHGRRKLKVDRRIAAKLAAALDLDVNEVLEHIEPSALTNRERKAYADYYRALRSTLRAERVHELVQGAMHAAEDLRIAIAQGRSCEKLLQSLENSLKDLDLTLAFRTRPTAKKWGRDVSDDRKLKPGRRAVDWGEDDDKLTG